MQSTKCPLLTPACSRTDRENSRPTTEASTRNLRVASDNPSICRTTASRMVGGKVPASRSSAPPDRATCMSCVRKNGLPPVSSRSRSTAAAPGLDPSDCSRRSLTSDAPRPESSATRHPGCRQMLPMILDLNSSRAVSESRCDPTINTRAFRNSDTKSSRRSSEGLSARCRSSSTTTTGSFSLRR